MTSTRGWVKRLGRRRQLLHRSVYLIAVLGVLHFIWVVKEGLLEPLIFSFPMQLPAYQVAALKGREVGRRRNLASR